jgi:RNA polymerase sigma-70 factor (ECF subfamily)
MQIADSRQRLYRVAVAWCANAMLADELVHETIVTAIVKRHQLKDTERLYAWLYSILKNNWRRHLMQAGRYDELDEETQSGDAGPIDVAEEHELVLAVRHAVACLPLKEREVIALVDLEGLSYCDVANALDIPIGTVMSRLHRARQRLLEKLDGSSGNGAVSQIHLVK